MQINTVRFREWVNLEYGLQLSDYDELWRWSVDDMPEFWGAVWKYFDIRSEQPFRTPLTDTQMPGARWFEGAQLNYVDQIRRHLDIAEIASSPAIVFVNEFLLAKGEQQTISWDLLLEQVATFAAVLESQGVQVGDRVAAYLPSAPQTVVAFLACASIGAVWTLCAPDMGLNTVLDRFTQVEPVTLIACDGYVYGGKCFDKVELVAQIVTQLPSLRTLVWVPYMTECGVKIPTQPALDWEGTVLLWSEAMEFRDRRLPLALPFEHPLWIVYSSGTTGRPKAIVHGHGGILLEMLKLHHLHLNLSAEPTGSERFHWYSSSGWVMWNLGVSTLLNGSTLCLYDGHPAYPGPDALWRFAEKVGLTFLGAGAAYFSSIAKSGYLPRLNVDTPRLRALGSTGSPLAPDTYEWASLALDHPVWWAVISGGTDIASAFLGGTPELSTRAGLMQARCLGADVQAWDEAGQPLIAEMGELVCVQPMPSMPLYFWNDQNQSRYLESYFDTYPGVWRHGDWLTVHEDGQVEVSGRSDATLNRFGHRLGTSELYNVVEQIPGILDSLAVDIEQIGRTSFLLLCVVLKEDMTLDDSLLRAIKDVIRTQLSPRFIPDDIQAVAGIPRTLTGKKLEVPVKRLLLGMSMDKDIVKETCANPEALDWFVQYAYESERRQSGSNK